MARTAKPRKSSNGSKPWNRPDTHHNRLLRKLPRMTAMAIQHQVALATAARFTPPSYLMRALLPFLICTMVSQPSAFAHPNQVTDPATPSGAAGLLRNVIAQSRSEEHTSELQSPTNLV